MIWGWRGIAKALNVKDLRTARKIAARYDMPILKINGWRVCISRESFDNRKMAV
jgi:hypothetical protein